MENTNKTGDKVFGFVYVVKHSEYNAAYSLKEIVQKITVIEKEMTEFLINGKDTVPVYAMNEFKGHRDRAFLGILHPARGASFVSIGINKSVMAFQMA
uniref:hypothetical protein n=1 Tax=Lacrimispora algidixylanolytica TaxID=94868 RepID=UPI001FAAF27A|nr:hypothetical protein [Lacrimispora algidixylanolytica]